MKLFKRMNVFDYLKAIEPFKQAIDDHEKRIKAHEQCDRLKIERNGEIYYAEASVTKVEQPDCIAGYLNPNMPHLTPNMVEAVNEYAAKHDILQRDPIELFKEDRQPYLTDRAIALVRRLGINTVGELTRQWEHDLLDIKGVGYLTVGYIESCLARHGLTLMSF